MLKLKVNNIDTEVEEGLTVLQACEKAGVILGVGPSYGTWSKKSESLKSNKGFGKNVEDRVKKISFQPISSTPFFAIGYSF